MTIFEEPSCWLTLTVGENRPPREALQRAEEAAMAELPFLLKGKLWQFQKWGVGGGRALKKMTVAFLAGAG